MKNTTTDKVRMFQLQYAGICEMCSELDEAQVEIQPQNDFYHLVLKDRKAFLLMNSGAVA